MNIYQLIGLILLIIIIGHMFELGPSIKMLAERLSDIPKFEDKGDNPALFDFAIRLAYLIALVGLVKIFYTSRRRDD